MPGNDSSEDETRCFFVSPRIQDRISLRAFLLYRNSRACMRKKIVSLPGVPTTWIIEDRVGTFDRVCIIRVHGDPPADVPHRSPRYEEGRRLSGIPSLETIVFVILLSLLPAVSLGSTAVTRLLITFLAVAYLLTIPIPKSLPGTGIS